MYPIPKKLHFFSYNYSLVFTASYTGGPGLKSRTEDGYPD